jgi:hypothetical protein
MNLYDIKKLEKISMWDHTTLKAPQKGAFFLDN